MRYSFLLAVVAIALIRTPLSGKCAWDRYVISGTLKDCNSKAPISGATIFAFPDAYERAYDLTTLTPPFRESWVSSSDGRFEIAAYFSRFKRERRLLGDDCSEVAKRLELFIVKDGYYTTRKEFTKLKIVQEKEDKLIALPDICIEPSTHP